MNYVDIVFRAVDLPLVIGMVFVIQMLKKFIKIDSKWYMVVNLFAGFFAAWLKSEVIGDKQFIAQGLVHAAANEFVYQSWRTIMDALKRRKR